MKEITIRFEGEIPAEIINNVIPRDDCLEFSIRTGLSRAEYGAMVDVECAKLRIVGLPLSKARIVAGEMVAINYFVD